MIERDIWDEARGDTVHEKKLIYKWTRRNTSYSERVEGANIIFLREESLVLIEK